eukprot:727529-Rhodomonas_salina.1
MSVTDDRICQYRTARTIVGYGSAGQRVGPYGTSGLDRVSTRQRVPATRAQYQKSRTSVPGL